VRNKRRSLTAQHSNKPSELLHIQALLHYTSKHCYITHPSIVTLHIQAFLHYTSKLCYITYPSIVTLHIQALLHYTSKLCYITHPSIVTLHIQALLHYNPSIVTLQIQALLHYTSKNCYITHPSFVRCNRVVKASSTSWTPCWNRVRFSRTSPAQLTLMTPFSERVNYKDD
jgi:hypothetical protein